MKKLSILVFALIFLSFIDVALAIDFTPQGNINLRDTYYITNNPAGSCPSGQTVVGTLANGSWNCSLSGSGDITGVLTPGDYLYGGCTSGDCSLYLNASYLNASGDLRWVSRSDWTTHDNYPSACSSGYYVRGIGDTLTCIADDDNPEAGDVQWSDLTDQGSFTDGRICTYASGTGYISCTSTDDDDPEPGDVAWSDLTDQGTFTDTKICTYNSTSGYIDCDYTDVSDDTVSSAELDGVCSTNERLIRRSGGTWACFDDSVYYDDTTLSQEAVEDYVGGMVSGTETHISVTYDDGTGNLNYVVADDWYDSLADLQGAVSNDFHNLGGTDDDNPEAGDVGWSDLTDEGTFTDTKYCTYASGTGYISCNSEGGSGETYYNGTGLALNGSNYFSIIIAYRLPQACGDGEIAEYNSTSGGWDCGIDNTAASGMASWVLAADDTAGTESITDGETVTFADDDKYLNATRSTNTITYSVNEAALNDTIDARDDDTQLTQEQVEDYAGALITDGTGTHTRISITYQDATGDIDFVVDDMNDDDPEPGDVHWSDLTDEGTFTDTKFCTYNSTSGYIDCTSDASSYSLDDDCSTNDRILRRAGGTWACFDDSVYYDDTTLTEEEVEDYVGGMLGGTETGITVTYQDSTNDIDFVVALGTSVDDTEMTAEDFGDFTCTGGEDGCTIDTGVLTIGTEVSATAGSSINMNGNDLTSVDCITFQSGGQICSG